MEPKLGEPSPSAQERELRELRARVADYHNQLSEAAALTRHLRSHADELLESWRRHPPQHRDLTRSLTDVARISALALRVARTSVWLFAEGGARLVCKVLLDGSESGTPSPEPSIVTADSPSYFQAISKAGVVAVEDIERDPRTKGLERYLRSYDVRALLDIAIAIPGEQIGVVCHEHTHSTRVWRAEEISFAVHVSDLLALSFEMQRRQLAETRMVGTEAKYRYLVESLPVTVYSFDPHSSRLEYLSPQIGELGGFDVAALLAGGVPAWLATIHPDDRPLVEARFEHGGVERVPAEIQYRLREPNGQLRYISDRCRVVRNHAGEPVAIQGVLADVSEQRRAEQHSRELEQRWLTLLKNVDLVAVILDRNGRAEFVNECFERVTGYRSEQVLGADLFELLSLPEETSSTRDRYLGHMQHGTIAPRFENEVTTRSGERRRIVWTNTLLHGLDGSIEGICSLGLDVTDRVRLESELLHQTKLESLGQLSAGVAHDFNNLLMVMGFQVDQLRVSPGGEHGQAALDALRQSLSQAEALTRSLLVYARREPVFPTPIDVDQLIREAAPLLNALTRNQVRLATSLHAGEARVLIDHAHLGQLLLNLAGNAVDATREHGGEVVISTALEFRDEAFAREHGASGCGEFVVLSVADDGRGMHQHTLARVFEPFFTTKERGQGTGLGLPMCQSIARRAGGFLTAESELGRGTTMRAFLPLGERIKATCETQPEQPAEAQTNGTHIALVAEDEPMVRDLIVALLEELSLTVRAVDSVEAARRVVASERVDLLITDGTLADGSGLVLARSARMTRPKLRVLLVSGTPGDPREFDATLQKPFTRAALQSAVSNLLDLQRSS